MFVGAVALCACDSTGDTAGLDATLETTPDWGCIGSVARGVHSVDIVREESNATGRRLTWRGVGPPGTAKTLLYKLGGITYALQVIDQPGESISYRNYSIFPRDTATSDALARSLDDAMQLAVTIEAACHIPDLVSKLKKHCYAKACPHNESVA